MPLERVAGEPGSLPVAARLQILATEHWSLLATRSLTWNESFSRSNIFLATLSGTIVALALVAQATSFGSEFLAFALVVLPVLLFIGLATFGRLVAANAEDVLWVRGMNLLRHAYLELAPDIEPYLIAGHHDDEAGVLETLGAPPAARAWHHHVFVTTPAVVGVVDSAIAGSIASLVGLAFDIAPGLALGVGVAVFCGVFAVLAVRLQRAFSEPDADRRVRFPTPSTTERPRPHQRGRKPGPSSRSTAIQPHVAGGAISGAAAHPPIGRMFRSPT